MEKIRMDKKKTQSRTSIMFGNRLMLWMRRHLNQLSFHPNSSTWKRSVSLPLLWLGTAMLLPSVHGISEEVTAPLPGLASGVSPRMPLFSHFGWVNLDDKCCWWQILSLWRTAQSRTPHQCLLLTGGSVFFQRWKQGLFTCFPRRGLQHNGEES